MSALTLGLFAALCWGIHDITIRYLSRSVPLMAALLCVLVVGALFQVGAITVMGEGRSITPTAIALSVGAGIGFLVASLGLYYAFERGPVKLVAPVIASYPILSISFAVMAGATVTIWQGVAVLMIVAGVGIVAALSDTGDKDVPPMGRTIALAALSAVGFACTFKLGQLAAGMSGELTTTLIARLTALLLLVALMAARRLTFWPGRGALVPLVVMGLLDGAALLSVMSAADLPSPEYAAVASSTFGLLTIVLAWVFLRERMSMPQWAGCLIAFAGIGYLAL